MISVEYTITDLNKLIYNFAFDYLKKKYVKVSSKNITTGIVTKYTYGVDYVVVDSTIELLHTVGDVGDVLRIVRETSTSEQIVSWNDASILKASDMSLAQLQQLHILEEYSEYMSINSLSLDINEQYDAKNSRIVNLVAPQTATDAVNRGYIDSFIGTLTDAQTSASLAQSWAIEDILNRPEGSSKYWATLSQFYASRTIEVSQDALRGTAMAMYESTGAGIINGFNATTSGNIVTIEAGIAHMITGYREKTTVTNIATNIADVTNKRIDLIYLSSDGIVSYLAGVASVNPIIPSVPSGGLGLWGVNVDINGTITLMDLRKFKARYQNKKNLSLLDFGIVGDGVTDNTDAIQKAIDYCIINRLSLFVPTGIYMINSTGLTITGSIEIFGPQIERLRGEWYYTYSGHSTGNNATFKFIGKYTNATMIKCTGTSKQGVNIHDIMLVGNDCICTTGTGTTPGTYDDTIVFTGSNTNGIDVQNFEHSSVNDCMIVGFSGVGLLAGLWQTHNRNDFANCNDSAVMGSTDSTFVDFYIHHSVNGIKIGTDDGTLAHMSRVLNARIEWVTGYGIKINYASDIKITGIIDRCTFAGIYAPDTYGHYAIDIDADVKRCGTYYRGASLAQVGTNYDKASNICIHGAQYASIRGSQILSNSKDDFTGAMAPVIGIYAVNTQYSNFKPVFVNDWSSRTQFLLLATGGLECNDQNELVMYNNADTGYFKFDKAKNAMILADKNPGVGNNGQPGFYQYYLKQSSPISIDLGPYIPPNKMVEIVCHIQAATNYESVIKLAVLKSYKGSTLKYTVATVYRLDTDNTLLAITATIDTTTGVMTIGNSSPGGVVYYKCEISVPH